MNWLDIVIIVLLIAGAIGGLIAGLIKTVFSLAGLIVGVVLAGRFYIPLSGYLGFIPSESGSHIVAFIIIFLAVMIIATLLGFLLTKLISAVLLGWLNRLGGAILGFLLGAIFIASFLIVIAKYLGAEGVISESALAPVLLDRIPLILAFLPSEFDTVRQFFQ
jgi:membrane protein required for colicin V production